MELQQAGIPHFTVIDSGCPDFFGGTPVLTAIGFGPTTKSEAKKIVKHLKLI
jgi:peptidyl-tRNA hydrolase